MRILYHHRTLADGAEGIHIAEMVSAFTELGHDVRVIGLAASGAGTRTRLAGAIKGSLPRGLAEIATAAGCNAAEYLEVRREIARYQPEFLYKRHARNDIAALAAVRTAGVPSVLEVNCLYSSPDYGRFEPVAFEAMTRRLEDGALRNSTRIVAVSSPLAAQIRQRGFDNVTVLPNGANPNVFDPARWSGLEVRARYGLLDATVVGWTGILRDWHGLELLLEALAKIPSTALLIVGDGPAKSALERRLNQLGMRDRTIMTGRVPHHDVPGHIAAMDIAVVADERTGVASPMKLLEYMSMARPIVAPRAENIKDLVDEQVDGLLFNPGDAQDLATQLHRLASDAALRRSLGASARTKIERERNWLSVAKAVLAAVRQGSQMRLQVVTSTTK